MSSSTRTYAFFLAILLSLFFFLSSAEASQTEVYDIDAEFEEDGGIDDYLIPDLDVDLLEFFLNLEYLEAELFLWASRGHGLDKVAPNLTMGGPPPIGVRKANLDGLTMDIISQFAIQQVGHIRALKKHIRGFPRPLLDLSANCFGMMMDKAFDEALQPPFDPYANTTNFLLASYLIPYVALTGYVGINPHLQGMLSLRLAAGLLGSLSAQDAVIRKMLYERGSRKVEPYEITVAEFTNRISKLRNRLGCAGVKDRGISLPPIKGSGGRLIPGSLIAGDKYSVAFERSPREVLRIMYGKAREHVPGGFFPQGANGRIARSFLQSSAQSIEEERAKLELM